MSERYVISAENANLILRHFEERPLKEAIKAGFTLNIPFDKEQTPEVIMKPNPAQKTEDTKEQKKAMY